MNTWVLVALAAFLLLLAFVTWLSRRQVKELDGWLDHKLASESWAPAVGDRAIQAQDWNWVRTLRRGRDVRIDRLVTNQSRGVIEAAFTLVTRRWGERAGMKRHVGVGIIAPLPRTISPALIATPVPSRKGGGTLRRLLRLDLPEVSIRDQDLARIWSVFSPEPQAAAGTLESDHALRSALARVFEEAVWEQTRFVLLIIELSGDRMTLLGGPKMIGRQPFTDLEETAGLLAVALRPRRGS